MEFKINGVGLDDVDDWQHVNQIDAVFNTNENLRAGGLKEGGMVLDGAGVFNSCKVDASNVNVKTNIGYTTRQRNFLTRNAQQGANYTFDYK